MAVLVSTHQISKTFGSKLVFRNISLAIEERMRIGLIGPNGAGKSTLLKIIAKEISPDSGQISYSQGLRLGYLVQDPKIKTDLDIYQYLLEFSDDSSDPRNMALAGELISKLDLDQTLNSEPTPLENLSEGWKKRVALACELMKRPNLLMMDEPTNHLDVESILWLENFLVSESTLGVVIITHDRLFLQNTCDVIFDLDPMLPNGFLMTRASYDQHLESRENLLAGQRSLEEKKRNTLRREVEWLRRGSIARQTKQSARIESAHDLKNQVADLIKKNSSRDIEIQFGKTEKAPKKLIEIKNITLKADERTLIQNFTALIRSHSRIGLLGPNGCGKSTLIRALLGDTQVSAGSLIRYDDLSVNYFEQKKQSIDPDLSLLKNLVDDGDYVDFQGQSIYARSYLARFHFRPDQMDLPARFLSGGEKSRLFIAKMMLKRAQLLILDEPTNDLDLETLDILAESLESFDGAVVLVTHNRHFLDQVAKEIWAFTPSAEILKFASFFQWQEWFEVDTTSRRAIGASAQFPQKAPAANSGKKRLSYKEQLEFDQIEEVILKTEELLNNHQLELSKTENQSNYARLTELTELVAKTQKQVETLYERWQFLTEKRG